MNDSIPLGRPEWSWKPVKAVTTRPGYPRDEKSLEKFARTYGDHYRETLKPFAPNPPGRLEKQGAVSCWIQDLLAGGQYATAWTEKPEGTKRTLFVSIANSHQEKSAARTAVKAVERAREVEMPGWLDAHRRWWHAYYKQSYVSLPDPALESLYWQTIYRLACTARPGTNIDTSGMWFQGGSWPYTTNDHNTQVAQVGLQDAARGSGQARNR